MVSKAHHYRVVSRRKAAEPSSSYLFSVEAWVLCISAIGIWFLGLIIGCSLSHNK